MNKLKRFLAVITAISARIFIKIKWKILGRYYAGLAVQAKFLYKQSSLYKERWQEFGYDYAEQSFENMAEHFFWKAKKEPLAVRWRIFCDAALGKEPTPYYIDN